LAKTLKINSNMLIRKKYQLPTIWKFQDKIFDIKKLQEEVLTLEGEYLSVMEANKALCSNNHELVMSVYEHFLQVNLTEFDPTQAAPTVEQCEIMGETVGTGDLMRKVDKYKLKAGRGARLDPALDEHNYNTPTQYYPSTSYFREVINSFKASAIRARIARIEPGRTLTPHIDYDPTYAVRVIVPIFAEAGVVNYFWRRNSQESYYLEPDGSAYFINIGFNHTVVNTSDKPRISLMFSLKTQDDLQEIPDQDWNETNNMENLKMVYETQKQLADEQLNVQTVL
jgi:hypothetical protein